VIAAADEAASGRLFCGFNLPKTGLAAQGLWEALWVGKTELYIFSASATADELAACGAFEHAGRES
jgi:hypothetical protein